MEATQSLKSSCKSTQHRLLEHHLPLNRARHVVQTMVVIIQDLEVVTKSTFLATLFTVIIMVAEVVVEIEIAPMPGGEMSDLYCNVEFRKD